MVRERIKRLLQRFGYRIHKVVPELPGRSLMVLDFVVYRLNQLRQGHVSFLQIGAHDGQSEDPLYPWLQRFAWQGVLIEPQPHLAEGLRALHKDRPNLQIIQAAVGSKPGVVNLWRVPLHLANGGDLTNFASLDRESLERKMSQRTEGANLERVEVQLITPTTAMEQAGLQEIDFLQIDAEGYDLEILLCFDFEKHKPPVVNYEHCNLSQVDRVRARQHLAQFGYSFATHLGDTVACHATLMPASSDRRSCFVDN
jgi:FkbM family methyltransferase